jgi:hypothetical protein
VVYTGLGFETWRHQGFLLRYGINVTLMAVVSLVIGYQVWKRLDAEKDEKLRLLYSLLQMGIMVLIFLLIIVSLMIFGKTGFLSNRILAIPQFMIVLMYTLALLALPLVARRSAALSWKVLIIVGVLGYILLNQFYGFGLLILERGRRAKDLLPLSNSDRLESIWGNLIPYMKFIQENTPENARILNPPQDNPWPETGNQFVIRRFLYPRTLIAPEWGKADFDYVMVDDGGKYITAPEELIGWPTEVYPIQKLLLLEPWKKYILLRTFTIDDKDVVMRVQKGESRYPSPATYVMKEKGLEIEGKYREVGYDFLWLRDQETLVKDQKIALEVETSQAFSVRSVVEFTTASGEKKYLFSAPNRTGTAEKTGIDTLTILNPLTQIHAYERNMGRTPRASYQIRIGVDLGTPRPIPYLYGKALLWVDKAPAATYQNCDELRCPIYIQHLLQEKQFGRAGKKLDELLLLSPKDPELLWMRSLVYRQEKNMEEEKKLLHLAGQYWSALGKHNMPAVRVKEIEDMQKLNTVTEGSN